MTLPTRNVFLFGEMEAWTVNTITKREAKGQKCTLLHLQISKSFFLKWREIWNNYGPWPLTESLSVCILSVCPVFVLVGIPQSKPPFLFITRINQSDTQYIKLWKKKKKIEWSFAQNDLRNIITIMPALSQ